MDTRQLRTLVTIAELGTFSRAAEVVHVTPSAVSQQMQALEAELGVPIFDRQSRPPTLNLSGYQLVETARSVLSMLDDTRSTLAGGKVHGKLDFGSVRTSAMSVVPRALVALRKAYPDLRINLRVSLSHKLIADVLASRLDMAVVAEQDHLPDTLRWDPFLREPLIVIAPPGTPPASGIELLRTMPFVRFGDQVPLSRIIDRELVRMKLAPHDIAEIDTVAAIVECVVAGLGVGIVPDVAISNHRHDLVTAPFGAPQIFRQIGIIRPIHTPKSAFFREVHSNLALTAGTYGIGPPPA